VDPEGWERVQRVPWNPPLDRTWTALRASILPEELFDQFFLHSVEIKSVYQLKEHLYDIETVIYCIPLFSAI